MNHSQVLPQLYVGSYPESTSEIDRLSRQSSITAVLNLQTDDDMRHFHLPWPPLQAHYAACGIDIRRVPVRDFDPVDLRAKLPECIRVLRELLAAPHTVYIHCTAGTGRSPTVVIAYLNWCCSWDLEEAVSHVKRCRQCSPNVEAIRLAIHNGPAPTGQRG